MLTCGTVYPSLLYLPAYLPLNGLLEPSLFAIHIRYSMNSKVIIRTGRMQTFFTFVTSLTPSSFPMPLFYAPTPILGQPLPDPLPTPPFLHKLCRQTDVNCIISQIKKIIRHQLTKFILDSNHKISTGVKNLFHGSAWIPIQRTLCKQFTYSA